MLSNLGKTDDGPGPSAETQILQKIYDKLSEENAAIKPLSVPSKCEPLDIWPFKRKLGHFKNPVQRAKPQNQKRMEWFAKNGYLLIREIERLNAEIETLKREHKEHVESLMSPRQYPK